MLSGVQSTIASMNNVDERLLTSKRSGEPGKSGSMKSGVNGGVEIGPKEPAMCDLAANQLD